MNALRVCLWTMGLAIIGLPARADAIPHDISAEIAGTCEEVLVGGSPATCASGVVRFNWHRSRSTLWSVPLESGRQLDFSGQWEDRPAPGVTGSGEYRLRVSGVAVFDGTSRFSTAIAVTGECRAIVTPDGGVWHRLECRARDASGAEYLLVLRGDGRRTTFLQYGRPVAFPATREAMRP